MVTGESFDLGGLLAQRGAERYELQARYVNPQLSKMLHAIGFDKIYTRAQGAAAELAGADKEEGCDLQGAFRNQRALVAVDCP